MIAFALPGVRVLLVLLSCAFALIRDMLAPEMDVDLEGCARHYRIIENRTMVVDLSALRGVAKSLDLRPYSLVKIEPREPLRYLLFKPSPRCSEFSRATAIGRP